MILSFFILSFLPYQNPSLEIIEDHRTIEIIEQDMLAVSHLNGLFIDENKINTLIKTLAEKSNQKPVNAKLDQNNEIIPEILGKQLDKVTLKRIFYEFFYAGKSMIFYLPTLPVYPKVDSELLSEIKQKEFSSFTTYYSSHNKERSRNIDLAAAEIDNYVIFPGELFSFNGIVGERTLEKGYQRAPVIVKGELAEDIGGGICQVSSTLFNAINIEGIEILERYSHSRSVPYVPPGKDAAVSWDGPDLVFKNNYNYPLLIRANANNGKIKITIYSSPLVKIKD